jgi:hypothetical protein
MTMKRPSHRAIEQFMDTYGIALLMADTASDRLAAYRRFEMARLTLFGAR